MSDYESRDMRFETITVDRREDYYIRSATFRNPRYDFAARYARGERYLRSMGWTPVKAPNVTWLAQEREQRQSQKQGPKRAG